MTPSTPTVLPERAGASLNKVSSAPVTWWRAMSNMQIGIIPLPIFVLAAAFLFVLDQLNAVPSDILSNIAILSLGGFACAEVGKRLPVLRHIGAAAIFATFVPSYLAYAGLIPVPILTSVKAFTAQSNFLYLFISAIIVGSILGMERRTLITGFIKIFAPLAAGSVVAGVIGTLTGVSLGLGWRQALFQVVIPIMSGGVGEGAIPLSVGYGSILHRPSGELFAEILPPVMLGSLFAIVLSGCLNFLGKRYPALTGDGALEPRDVPTGPERAPKDETAPDLKTIGAATVMLVTLYLGGVMTQRLWGWPAPVVMLFAVVAIKLAKAITPDLERGAFSVYRFFSTAVTYPLLFAIGASMTPWDKLFQALAIPNLITIFVTVVVNLVTGFYVGRRLGMYPIDTAIVTACHTGQGGTGDVAILTAANRLQLMPFAQIATRIGGAITVVFALLLLVRLGGQL